jgi:branched-chain amino acid transport system substrate-binding protein
MIYARFLLETRPNAKIGVLHENDDLGRDYLRGLKQGLGDKASTMIVAEKSHEITDPTIDSAVVSIEAAGADTFCNSPTSAMPRKAFAKSGSFKLETAPDHLLERCEHRTNAGRSGYREL